MPLPSLSPTDNSAGANTLLAYFHYCNKGIYPFSAECKDQDLQSLAELDNDALSFVKYTRRFAAEHSELRPNRHEPEFWAALISPCFLQTGNGRIFGMGESMRTNITT